MNLKALIEKRNQKIVEIEALMEKPSKETRAMTDEENAKYNELMQEIKNLAETISAIQETMKIDTSNSSNSDVNSSKESEETRAFADYITGRVSELRAGEQNMTMSNNGAIIPVTIADRIIKTVKDLCPIFAKATMYNVKGTLKIPVWGKANSTHDIAVGYQTEFTEITADSGKFTSIDLGGYLAGALVLIGKSVENNGSFSVVDFVVNQMAEEIATFLEKELLTGTGSNSAQGAINTSNTLTSASSTAISADDLIALQSQVKQVYQANSAWTMNKDTFLAIKKLKDSNGRYLLQDNITAEFPYMLLGKPVYISENMPDITASAKTVLYGDYSGVSVNFRENITIEILREKYATQHAIGVNAWFEFDSKITDNQKLAVLVQKGS